MTRPFQRHWQAPDWVVYGPASLSTFPIIAQWDEVNGSTQSIEVVSSVLTVRSECGDEIVPDSPEAVFDRLADRPDVRSGHFEITTYAESEAVTGETVEAKVDGEIVSAQVYTQGAFSLWRLTVGAVTITAHGRMSRDSVLALAGLDPIILATTAALQFGPIGHARTHGSQGIAQNPAADAHRNLVRGVLETVPALEDEFRKGLPSRSALPAGWERRWSEAVSAQVLRTGQRHIDAQRAVQLMIDQILELKRTMPWFENAQTRDRAIDELIELTLTGDESLPSFSAQQRWVESDVFSFVTTSSFENSRSTLNLQQLLERTNQARRDWEDAWRNWPLGEA